MGKALTIEEALLHAGDINPYSLEVEERVREAIPHYIWTQGDARHREGFCTKCRQWMDVREDNLVPSYAANDPYDEGYLEWEEFERGDMGGKRNKVSGRSRHKDYGYCPKCFGNIQFRSLNMGRKTVRDEIFLIIYRKSMMEDNALVCIGYEVVVDWNEFDEYEPFDIPWTIRPRELCVFRYGKGADRFIRKPEWNWVGDKGAAAVPSIGPWHRTQECKSGFNPKRTPGGWGVTPVVLDKVSFYDAIWETRFETVLDAVDYKAMEYEWSYFDKITVMANIAKHPCAEYLAKLGHTELAGIVVAGLNRGRLNLRGKTAHKVLRVTENKWGEIKGHKIAVTSGLLDVLHEVNRHKLKMDVRLCEYINKETAGASVFEQILKMHTKLNIVKAVKYCRRKKVHLMDYRDYLEQMVQLKMNVEDERTAFPGDFEEMHARLSERCIEVDNKRSNQGIQEQLDILGNFTFSAYGFVLRPFVSAGEVIAEGTALHHCVGDYVAHYAAGNIVLCALRREEALGTPLYTVEFDEKGGLVQCRGYRNRMDPKDKKTIDQFFALFSLMRKENPDRKKRGQKRRKAA